MNFASTLTLKAGIKAVGLNPTQSLVLQHEVKSESESSSPPEKHAADAQPEVKGTKRSKK